MPDVHTVGAPQAGLSLTELDDGELLALARLDNEDAYAALFTRYTYAAHRLARHLGQREEAEDVVSESFAQVLDLVRRGKGPDRAFRAYLFTTIRHEAGRRAKARQRVMPTDDDRQIDSAVPFGNGQLDEFEKSAIRAAYESLPERWRTVLWHLDVEGRKPHELGPLLDLSPNSVSALVYRARSGLRQAYLQQHVKDEGPADSRACRGVRNKLSTLVRLTASAREQEKIHTHLETCSECMAIYLDLQEVNREVGSIVVPVALAVSVVGLAAGAGASGAWAAFTANLALLGKGLLAAVAPAATVTALTTATVVGLTASEVTDPPRYPAVQAVTPAAERVRIHPAAPRSKPRSTEGPSPIDSATAEPDSGGPDVPPASEMPATADPGSAEQPTGDPAPSAGTEQSSSVPEVGSGGVDAHIPGIASISTTLPKLAAPQGLSSSIAKAVSILDPLVGTDSSQ